MNGLGYADFVDWPQAIFRGWNAAQIYNDLTFAVTEAAGNGGRPLSELVRARLKWYPHLASNLILEGLLKPADIDSILADPSARFWALANHYEELAPLLEAKLLEDPESAERMYRWTHFKGVDRFHSPDDYLAALGDDPMRHFRLTPPDERPTAAVLAPEAAKNRTRNAAWAFMYLTTHRSASIEADLVKCLLESEEYSALAIVLLRKSRQLPPGEWQTLIQGIKSPRWAYYVMVVAEPGTELGVFYKNALMRILWASPPWLVQFCEKKGWSGKILDKQYSACIEVAATHECAPELRSWYRLRKAVESKPLVAAKR